MKIEKVYCIEMKRLTGIYEAREYYFQNNRADLNFLCSSEECLKAQIPVIGVNYRSLPEKKIVQTEAHFRSHYKYPHKSSCVWLEMEQARNELEEEEADVRIHGRQRTAKATDHYELFIPKSGPDGGDEIFDPAILRTVPLPAERDKRKDTLKQYLRQGRSRTTLLENLVTCYLKLSKRERQERKLSIKKFEKRSFSEVFTHIKNYQPKIAEQHVFYGGARIKKYGNNYSLKFMDNINFDEGNGAEEKPVSLYIREEDLTVYKQRAFLTSVLEKLASEETWVTIYFYGIIRTSEKNPKFYEVVLAHYDNLVLKPKSNPPK